MKTLSWGTSLTLYLLLSLCGVYCMHALLNWIQPVTPPRDQYYPPVYIPAEDVPVNYNSPEFTK